MFYLVKVVIEFGVMMLDHPFSYAYEGDEIIRRGMRVRVPFGHNELVGFVVEDSVKIDEDKEEYALRNNIKLRDIIEVIDEDSILNGELMDLANDISSYYVTPLIDILKTMLPPSLRPEKSSYSKPKLHYLDFVFKNENISLEGLTKNEIKLLDSIDEEGVLLSKVKSLKSFKSLLDKNLVRVESKEQRRTVDVDILDEFKIHELNEEQQEAFNTIEKESMNYFLLEGVTGSGKTEVYLKLVNEALKRDEGSLILVPEIALTDRLIQLFKSIFFDEVALIHSGLTDAQKYHEYLRISRGEAKIVVGARSAIFAPVKNLKYIIIDEEHVDSYKQDVAPYYDARTIARMRVKYNSGLKVIYGSATPSLECRARALKGVYKLVRLNNRYNKNDLPEVEIVDLSNYENIDYDSALISIPLRERIDETLKRNEQVLLLLNRRGYSPIYICRNCQKPYKCPNCNLPLTYHKGDKSIKCHHCEYELSEEELVCPNCGEKEFSYVGFGTERVVEELERLFPTARICRLDGDVSRKKGAYHRIINDFSKGRYDILVGTQMIAKGHDFPNVTLACSLLADQSLGFPSYRANEETFDLLTQLVGRAGRKDKKGRALIQTYSVENDVLNLVKTQDYEAFFKYEMENRKARQYPPYTYLAILTISSKDKNRAIDASYKLKNYLIEKFARKRVNIYGPSIPYLERINNRFYRKIMIKYKSHDDVVDALKGVYTLVFDSSDVKIVIDVDPTNDF